MNGDCEKIESEKITISIGLIAFLITLIYGLNQFLPIQNNFFSILARDTIYFFFGISSICFFIYLILKAASLRSKNSERLGYMGIPVTQNIMNSFFDLGANLIIMSPMMVIIVIFIDYLQPFLIKRLGISSAFSLGISVGLFLILNIFIALITKKERDKVKIELIKS